MIHVIPFADVIAGGGIGIRRDEFEHYLHDADHKKDDYAPNAESVNPSLEALRILDQLDRGFSEMQVHIDAYTNGGQKSGYDQDAQEDCFFFSFIICLFSLLYQNAGKSLRRSQSCIFEVTVFVSFKNTVCPRSLNPLHAVRISFSTVAMTGFLVFSSLFPGPRYTRCCPRSVPGGSYSIWRFGRQLFIFSIEVLNDILIL